MEEGNMTGYINFIFQSLILSVTMVFFLADDCVDKRKGFATYLLLELVNNYVLFRILWSTEAGIALPQVMVWRIVLYVVYITFRLGWFRLFTKNYYRNFLLTYFYIWMALYTAIAIVYAVIHFVFPEEIAVDAMSSMPKTGIGLIIHLVVSVWAALCTVWVKRRNWIQKLSTNFLCVFFAFIFIFADVGSTFLLVKPQMQSITIVEILIINILFLLAASYVGYVNYLKTSAQKEHEKIQQIMKRQFQAYEALSKKENEIRRIRHDLANHLQVIKGVENKEKENLSQQYQKNLKEIFENISLIRESEPREDLTVDTKKFSSSTAW